VTGGAYVPPHTWQPPGTSTALALKEAGRARSFLDSLTAPELSALRHKWDFWARPAQKMPPASAVPHKLGWKYWTNLAGRGYGKTRVAAEAIRQLVVDRKVNHIALVGPTYRDVVQTMIRGESGIENVFPANGPIRPRFVKNDNAVYFERGRERLATASVYTGEEPERLRGPQHDFAWFDELGAFKYALDVWKLFIAGHRLGPNPRAILTTTPRASLLAVEGLLEHPRTLVTFGRTVDNQDNLAPDTVETLLSVYKDTDFAAQELDGVLHLDERGALFRSSWLHDHRVPAVKVRPGFVGDVPIVRYAVIIDPSGSEKSTACECGVVVMGLGADNNAYLLEDLSKRAAPDEWASTAVRAHARFAVGGVPCVIVYESNYGGGMVGKVLRDTAKQLGLTVATRAVEAKENKAQRAMKASPLVQRGRARLVGFHPDLERQLTTWEPGSSGSPDRLDAFVWGCITLLLNQPPRGMV
jgi:phage terminase large subunit-like protein